ncbi:MAG TPA: hypothetical protein VN702_11870 [Acetobacteraceae bacterium]|nr:hypothetical protein [Acetobacteraceae bacterium]
MRARLPSFLLVLLLASGAASAQTNVSDAEALQQQVHTWTERVFGPASPMASIPLQIAPDGDHYRITLSLGGTGDQPGYEVTAALRPLDAGQWAIDTVKVPPSGSFHLPGSTDGPTDFTFTLGGQDGHALLDPSLRAKSTMGAEIRELAITGDGHGQHHEQRIDKAVSRGSLTPTANSRLDLEQTGTVTGLRSATRSDKGVVAGIGIGQAVQTGRIDGLNPDQAVAVLRAVSELMAIQRAHPTPKGEHPHLTPEGRVQVRALIAGLRDLCTRLVSDETMHDVQIDIGGNVKAMLKQLKLGFGAEAPDGRLHAWLDIGVDEPKVSAVPPDMADLVPTHVSFRPVVSGVDTGALLQFLSDAAADQSDEKKLQTEGYALLAGKDANVGIEALRLNLGPMQVDGSARVLMTTPDEPGLDAHISAAGTDAFMEAAKTQPALKRALPMILMARGMARPKGDRLVWDITYIKGRVTVNGTDMSALAGAPPSPKRHDKGHDNR